MHIHTPDVEAVPAEAEATPAGLGALARSQPEHQARGFESRAHSRQRVRTRRGIEDLHKLARQCPKRRLQQGRAAQEAAQTMAHHCRHCMSRLVQQHNLCARMVAIVCGVDLPSLLSCMRAYDMSMGVEMRANGVQWDMTYVRQRIACCPPIVETALEKPTAQATRAACAALVKVVPTSITCELR